VNPHSVLLDGGGGVFYGTTYYGGSDSSGTVYELTCSGGSCSESVIYTFTGGSDGSNPHAGLIMDSNGALYGTTVFGGANSKGTVYKLVESGGSWTETVLYSFGASSSDAAIALAGWCSAAPKACSTGPLPREADRRAACMAAARFTN